MIHLLCKVDGYEFRDTISLRCIHVSPITRPVSPWRVEAKQKRHALQEMVAGRCNLKVAVVELDRQALLASVRHGAAIGFDGDNSVSPAGAVKPFLLEDVELLLTDPVFETQEAAMRGASVEPCAVV